MCRGKVNRSRKHEEDITVSRNCDVMPLKCQNKTKYMELHVRKLSIHVDKCSPKLNTLPSFDIHVQQGDDTAKDLLTWIFRFDTSAKISTFYQTRHL
jgi:hypothetical protein